MATTTDISTLKINYLTQAQYDAALANNQINANELYLTPAAPVGSVTSISVSNATDGGLTISGSPVTTSGTITIGHSNVLSSAQTTQAVYPIKIDKNGHISAYGTAVTPLTSSSTLDATKLSGTIPASCYTNTNTTYTLSGALNSHAFTSTLTAGGSGSGTSTSVLTLAEGTGISLTDDTTNKKITIGHSNSVTASTAGTSSATSGSTLAVPYITYDAQGHITATGTHTHTISGFVPTTRTVNGKALSADIADSDYVTSHSADSGFYYRKWNSGTVEAWGYKTFNATAGTAWGNMYYYDFSITIPSGIFSSEPLRGIASCTNFQWIVAGVSIISATSVKVRMVKPVSSSQNGGVYIYLFA